jgi:hypothetical protein
MADVPSMRRVRKWLLVSSIFASVATGALATLLLSRGELPTAWLVVSLLTFIAIQTGVQSSRVMREEVMDEALDFASRTNPPVVTTTLPDGTPL